MTARRHWVSARASFIDFEDARRRAQA